MSAIHDKTLYRAIVERRSDGSDTVVQHTTPGLRGKEKVQEWIDKNWPGSEVIAWQYSILYWKYEEEK